MAMLSRVADSLYWMGRYLERAEHMARLREITRDLLVDLAEVDPEGATVEWEATVATLGVKDTTVEELVFDRTEPSASGWRSSAAAPTSCRRRRRTSCGSRC